MERQHELLAADIGEVVVLIESDAADREIGGNAFAFEVDAGHHLRVAVDEDLAVDARDDRALRIAVADAVDRLAGVEREDLLPAAVQAGPALPLEFGLRIPG